MTPMGVFGANRARGAAATQATATRRGRRARRRDLTLLWFGRRAARRTRLPRAFETIFRFVAACREASGSSQDSQCGAVQAAAAGVVAAAAETEAAVSVVRCTAYASAQQTSRVLVPGGCANPCTSGIVALHDSSDVGTATAL